MSLNQAPEKGLFFKKVSYFKRNLNFRVCFEWKADWGVLLILWMLKTHSRYSEMSHQGFLEVVMSLCNHSHASKNTPWADVGTRWAVPTQTCKSWPIRADSALTEGGFLKRQALKTAGESRCCSNGQRCLHIKAFKLFPVEIQNRCMKI